MRSWWSLRNINYTAYAAQNVIHYFYFLKNINYTLPIRFLNETMQVYLSIHVYTEDRTNVPPPPSKSRSTWLVHTFQCNETNRQYHPYSNFVDDSSLQQMCEVFK